MCRRVLSAWLVVLTLLMGTGVRAQQEVKEKERVGDEVEEAKLTAEEEREAVQLAERFVKGLEEKSSPLSLIDELYVKDFDARLRRNELNSYIYLAKVEAEVTASATDEELRRLYAASLNYIYAVMFLYGINSYNRKLRGEEEDDDPSPEDLMPPEALAVLKNDPLIAALIAEEERQEREKQEQANGPEQVEDNDTRKDEKPDGAEIKSLERMRGFTSTLEKASVLIKEYIKTAQVPHNWKELKSALKTVKGEEGAEDDDETIRPRLLILDEDFFGAPKETRLICVKVMTFHMDLIRVDGRLRILNVYIASD